MASCSGPAEGEESAEAGAPQMMDDDFVDVFPSAGGVGDSPVRSTAGSERGSGITGGDTSRGQALSLSIGIETGGAAAAVSPAIHPYSHNSWIVMPSPSPAAAASKESALRSARMVSDVMEQQQQQQQQENKDVAIFCGAGGDTGDRSDAVVEASPAPSPAPMRFGMAPTLTIDPGGECEPTELEKKRQKLERYRFVCSEVCVCVCVCGKTSSIALLKIGVFERGQVM